MIMLNCFNECYTLFSHSHRFSAFFSVHRSVRLFASMKVWILEEQEFEN